MPVMMYCPVDRVIETTLGYVFGFTKNEPLPIPNRLVPYMMEKGVIPVEGEEEKAADATAETQTDKQREPTDYDSRIDAVKLKILELHANGVLVYTAGQKPNPAQLSKELKFRIDAAERDVAWDAVKAQVAQG